MIFLINHWLSHCSDYNMTNIFRISHFLRTYFTSLQASEITVKYEKREKHTLVIAQFRVQCDQYFPSFSYFANSFHEPLGENMQKSK